MGKPSRIATWIATGITVVTVVLLYVVALIASLNPEGTRWVVLGIMVAALALLTCMWVRLFRRRG